VRLLLTRVEERVHGPRTRLVGNATPGRNIGIDAAATRSRPHGIGVADSGFIDASGQFTFSSEAWSAPPNAVPFDMFGVELTHQGEKCTFEVLCDTFAVHEPALARIAAIVHDLDLKDERFKAVEAPACRHRWSAIGGTGRSSAARQRDLTLRSPVPEFCPGRAAQRAKTRRAQAHRACPQQPATTLIDHTAPPDPAEVIAVPTWRLYLYFLRLGTIGFGGPIALAGFMQRDLVETRRWIGRQDYVDDSTAFAAHVRQGAIARALPINQSHRNFHPTTAYLGNVIT
jgi:hypothetical protein